eukprot:4292911-Pleurochrysis_carterae.AAC.1
MWLAVYARDGLIRSACVDQVFPKRVHVPRTPAVNDESNATCPVGQASIVSTRVTLRVSGEQDTRMRSEGGGHRGAGPRSGARWCSLRVSFHAR